MATEPAAPEPKPQEEPRKDPGGMDEVLRQAILNAAMDLQMSGEPDLESKGLVLTVATSRGDVRVVRKVLGELEKMAKEEGVDYAAETYGYLKDSLPKEGAGA